MDDIVVEVIPVLKEMGMVLLVLAVLVFVLSKLLYEPVSQFIKDRENKIQEELNNATKLEKEMEEIKANFDATMADAREEGQKIVAASRERGEELSENIIKDAKEEAEQIKERARMEMEKEKEALYNEVKRESGEMALIIASKIMEKEMDEKTQAHLIDEFLSEVGNSQWQN